MATQGTTHSKMALLDGETLAQSAYRALRSDIICGVRAPGERLRINRLSDIYNVGPTPLREALQRLDAENLVVSEGNRGFMVAPVDPAEFDDLNIARIAVEKEALRLSIAKGDAEWEAGVVAARHLMERADTALSNGSEGAQDQWEAANSRFHLAMVAACGSNWLLQTRSHLHALCERYRLVAIRNSRGRRGLETEHRAIADAVLNRDAERACELTQQHYERTAHSLFENVTREDAGAA